MDPDRSMRNHTCTGWSLSTSLPATLSGVAGVTLDDRMALMRSATTRTSSRSPRVVMWSGQIVEPKRAPRQAPVMEATVSVSPPAETASNKPSGLAPLAVAHHKAAGTASMAIAPVPTIASTDSAGWPMRAGRTRRRSTTLFPAAAPCSNREAMSVTASIHEPSRGPSPVAARATAAARAAAAVVPTGCPWVTDVDSAAS